MPRISTPAATDLRAHRYIVVIDDVQRLALSATATTVAGAAAAVNTLVLELVLTTAPITWDSARTVTITQLDRTSEGRVLFTYQNCELLSHVVAWDSRSDHKTVELCTLSYTSVTAEEIKAPEPPRR